MRALLLLVALALAGCAREPPGSFTLDLDAAAPSDVLPRVAVPEGFVLDQNVVIMPREGLVEGTLLGYVRGDWAQRERILLGMQLHASHEAAASELDRLVRDPDGATSYTPLALADGAWTENHARSGRDHGGSNAVIARVDAYVFWVAYDAIGLEPALEAEPIAREIVGLLESSDQNSAGTF